MTVSAALVLFAVVWFMVLYIILPLRMQSQNEAGDVVPGTPESAPVDPKLGKKVIWVTIVTLAIWTPLVWLISSGLISVRDIDFFGRMGPVS